MDSLLKSHKSKKLKKPQKATAVLVEEICHHQKKLPKIKNDHDLLRVILLNHILASDWKFTFHIHAHHLTWYPLPKEVPTRKALIPGPKNLAALTRVFYCWLFHNNPLINVHGHVYVKKLDDHLEKVYEPAIIGFTRATQIDILAASSNIFSSLIHISHDVKRHLHHPDFKDWIHEHYDEEDLEYWIKKTIQSPNSIDIRGPNRTNAASIEPVATQDSCRSTNFLGLCTSIKKLIATLESTPKDQDIWTIFRDSKSIKHLPQTYQDLFKYFSDFLSHLFVLFLEDKDRRANFRKAYDRLPVTLIGTTLRWVNPTPFVEQMVKMFVWKPPGVPSLIQIVTSYFLRESESIEKLEKLKKSITEDKLKNLENYLLQTSTIQNTDLRIEAIQKNFNVELNAIEKEFYPIS